MHWFSKNSIILQYTTTVKWYFMKQQKKKHQRILLCWKTFIKIPCFVLSQNVTTTKNPHYCQNTNKAALLQSGNFWVWDWSSLQKPSLAILFPFRMKSREIPNLILCGCRARAMLAQWSHGLRETLGLYTWLTLWGKGTSHQGKTMEKQSHFLRLLTLKVSMRKSLWPSTSKNIVILQSLT